ncbi:MAG TPA: ThiF family adenylyltransferase [Aggregatilineales bacterium]|nr:ThiF family adenylyltransferase [Aggregatilineales bacterium]
MTDSTDATGRAEWDRVERYLGHDALSRLAGKSVAIVGLGSGGGFVAQTLAMSGVGRFVLIDDDHIEASNVVRHVADSRYLQMPKVEGVADLIRHRNPQAEVQPVFGRLSDSLDALDGVDLIISGVDGERAKYEINVAARARGLTAVYAGVYERGEGGDVVLIRPTPDSPCYACWAERLRENVAEAIPSESELDYGMIGPDGTIAAEPGLWLHVVRVAAAQADIALNELLLGLPIHREFPANTVILANVELEVFEGIVIPPYSAQWIDVARNRECLVCGDSHKAAAQSLDELAGDLLVDDNRQNQGRNSGKSGKMS